MAEQKKLSVAIAAGGTAGHINPALALAEELRERGHQVTFYGQPNKLEGTLVPEAGFELVPIHVNGFDRRRPWTLISAAYNLERAKMQLHKRFKEQGAPDVAIGFGAYVELPLLQLCAKLHIPYLIHEQNSVTGLANRVSAGKASKVCIAFPEARKAFEGRVKTSDTIVVTGNPVRKSVLSADRATSRQELGIADNQTLLLIFGGSLGARSINETFAALKQELLSRPNFRIIQSTGQKLYDEVVSLMKLSDEEAARWEIKPYISNMGATLAAADLVVSRSGASSVAEIAALELPSILVPYPLATADHQTINAHLLSDAGAAILVPDNQVGTTTFSAALFDLVDNADQRKKLSEAAATLDQRSAASLVADAVESAVCGA